MTRNGKIARLPREIREHLNQRLRDGHQGKVIVEWLYDLGEVTNHMDTYFDGRPITEQNLSEWKKGGYQDWLKEQEAREMARRLGEYGDAVAEESGLVPLSDRLSGMIALALGRMLLNLTSGPLETPEQRKEFFLLARELALHRRNDHNAAWLRLELDREEERRTKVKKNEEAAKERHEKSRPWAEFCYAASREAAFRHIIGEMPLDAENRLRKGLDMPERTEEHSAGTQPSNVSDDPTESN